MNEKRQTCPGCGVTRFGDAQYCVCGHKWLSWPEQWLNNLEFGVDYVGLDRVL